MAEHEHRYTLAVLRPGTRELMVHHKINQEVTAGLLLDPEWWGAHPPKGKRLIRVVRCLDKAEWPDGERNGACSDWLFVVESEWV